MSQQVCMGALIRCSFGAAPGSLTVLPMHRVTAGTMPAATILDHAPLLNVPPLGLCSSPANPMVAAATAAAMGVLTPMPCIPATPSPWVPGSPSVLIGDTPALDQGCRLLCNWGGVISISAPGQCTVLLA